MTMRPWLYLFLDFASSFIFEPLYRQLILSANLQEANEESKSVTKASAMKGAASLVDKDKYIHFLAEWSNWKSETFVQISRLPAIKGRMEKDIDEVGKIARNVKVKLEQMDRNVQTTWSSVCDSHDARHGSFSFPILQNLENRKKPGCGKGTSVDRSRMSMTM